MIQYQQAKAADLFAIASLHTDNWRRHYRGVMSPVYLENEIESERLKVWQKRFKTPDPNQDIIIAKEQDTLLGFVCTYFNSPEDYPEAMLDNIHVQHGYGGNGIGRQLFCHAARWIHQQSPDRSLYLWVLADNEGAIAFYKKLKGSAREIEDWKMPGGGTTKIIRYVWEDLSPFI